MEIKEIDKKDIMRLAIEQKLRENLPQISIKQQVNEQTQNTKKIKQTTPNIKENKQKLSQDNTPRRKGF